MRHDMSKVLVERPRRGGKTGSHHPARAAKKVQLFIDEDGQYDVADEFTGSNRAATRTLLGWDRKELNENLNPLYRYLESQVGRLWDDVYSEVCEHINSGSTVQQHILVHLFQHVETNTWLATDGRVYTDGRAYQNGPVQVDEESYNSRWGQLYVHPHTRLLCKARRVKRDKHVEPKLEFFFVSNELGFVKEDGIWFRVTSEPITMKHYDKLLAARSAALEAKTYYGPETDRFGVFVPAPSKYKANDFFRFKRFAEKTYGRAVWVTKKETANKRELKRYKLNEPEPLKFELVKQGKASDR